MVRKTRLFWHSSRIYIMLSQSSGVSVNDVCLTTFQDLKLKKKYTYITFVLNKEKTEIIVDKTSTSKDYEDFLADLPENECRWGVYDFEFQKEEGGQRNKIVFYHWYVVFNPNNKSLPARTPHRSHQVFIFIFIFFKSCARSTIGSFFSLFLFSNVCCDNDASRL